jgi:hypothetical protein
MIPSRSFGVRHLERLRQKAKKKELERKAKFLGRNKLRKRKQNKFN